MIRKLLLVGWDAADWKLINPLLDAGMLPALNGLIGRGVMGNITTLQPMMSPMLWTSIATGKTADQHGILGFIEPDPFTGGVRAAASTSRKGKALWNILNQNEFRSLVVGWFASQPAEPVNGVYISNLFAKPASAVREPWPVTPGSVHPARVEASLAALRVHPSDLTGDDLLPFVPELARID
ncbi:MAG: alkaline phosphatase family protein [Bryobacteraceae bacterium]